MSKIQNLNTSYGLNQPLNELPFPPIIALRDPETNDKANLGTMWVNKDAGRAFVLTSIVNGSYIWEPLAGAVTLPSLTVNPGPISLTGDTTINITGTEQTSIGNTSADVFLTGDNVNITGSGTGVITLSGETAINGDTFINFATNNNTTIGNTGDTSIFGNNITIGSILSLPLTFIFGDPVSINNSGAGATRIGNSTGGTTVDGLILINNGANISNGLIASGSIGLNVGSSSNTSIGTLGTGTVTIGNTTGNTGITGDLTVSTDITSTSGDITAASGNVNCVRLNIGGPVSIQAGAGAPAGGLAVNVGDLYINTTAATASTRLYIAISAGVWASFTASA